MLHDVYELNFGTTCRTRIWLSETALKELSRFRRKGDPNGVWFKKLKHHAVNGLVNAERSTPPIVRHEGQGVYRIGFRDSLFRLVGFYSNGQKSEFIVIDALTKSGQKLSKAERDRIKAIADVKSSVLWRRVLDG